ncbi:hypothetical protein D3C81_1545040 [compost metagenome]
MPGRAIGDQRIPAPGAPGFGDAIALQDEVRNAKLGQVLAHGHAGLTGSDDKRIYFFDGPVRALLEDGAIQVGHGSIPQTLIIVVRLWRLAMRCWPHSVQSREFAKL